MKFEEVLTALREGGQITNDFLEPDECYAAYWEMEKDNHPNEGFLSSEDLMQRKPSMALIKGSGILGERMRYPTSVSFKQIMDDSWRIIGDEE